MLGGLGGALGVFLVWFFWGVGFQRITLPPSEESTNVVESLAKEPFAKDHPNQGDP